MKSFSTVRDTQRGSQSYMEKRRARREIEVARRIRRGIKTGQGKFSSIQFISVAQSCPTLCDSMDCSTPRLPVQHQLLESTQTHIHWVNDTIQPSHPLSSPSLHPQSFPASGSFQMSQLFASGGQSIGVSASTSVLPMNTQEITHDIFHRTRTNNPKIYLEPYVWFANVQKTWKNSTKNS